MSLEPEPRRLFRCPAPHAYIPTPASADYPIQLDSNLQLTPDSIAVTYTLKNPTADPYYAFVVVGEKDGLGFGRDVQVDVHDGVAYLKKQYAAFCVVRSQPDSLPYLNPVTTPIPPGGEFAESLVVRRPLTANYTPRADSLLAERDEDEPPSPGKFLEFKASKLVHVSRIVVGIGVAADPALDNQRVLYSVHELEEPLEARAYEIVDNEQ